MGDYREDEVVMWKEEKIKDYKKDGDVGFEDKANHKKDGDMGFEDGVDYGKGAYHMLKCMGLEGMGYHEEDRAVMWEEEKIKDYKKDGDIGFEDKGDYGKGGDMGFEDGVDYG